MVFALFNPDWLKFAVGEGPAFINITEALG